MIRQTTTNTMSATVSNLEPNSLAVPVFLATMPSIDQRNSFRLQERLCDHEIQMLHLIQRAGRIPHSESTKLSIFQQLPKESQQTLISEWNPGERNDQGDPLPDYTSPENSSLTS